MSKWRCRQTIALLAAQRLVNRGIQLRKQYVSALLKAVKKIYELDNKTHHDFGEGVHSVRSEPIIMNLHSKKWGVTVHLCHGVLGHFHIMLV